jgi:3-oxoadipyl-CoA thiolase
MTKAAYICDGVRTPFGRFGGALATLRADDLAAIPLAALAARHPGLDKGLIDEVVLGAANQSGEDNRNVARMALLLAGYPDSVPGVTVNRLCASGLEAAAYAGRAIAAGEADIVIAGGAESMTRAPFVMGKAQGAFARDARLEDTTMGWRFINPRLRAAYGVDTMPETAENVAAEFQIARADQDAFALRSQQRYAAAQARGYFDAELLAVDVPAGKAGTLQVTRDEPPRPDTSLDALARLKPVVREGGSVTAGNASGINDGAAALLIASEEAVRRHGLTPRARIVGYATAGVAPRLMGIGPVPATRRVLQKTGLKLSDIDLIELNEAFAAQALAVLRQLGLPDDSESVNPHGGAIAIGHPLGASGARLVLTAMRTLEERRAKRALITLCIGVGQGAAMIIENI